MTNLEKIDASRRPVRKFGIMFAVIGAVVSAYLVYKGSEYWGWSAALACFFLGTGLFWYKILRPIYVGWMRFAFVLGWVNTRLLLGLFFYLVLTPIGIIVRLSGRDLLDQKIERSWKSYWITRETTPFDPKRCERLF